MKYDISHHTWVWNRGICICVIVRPHVDRVKKSNPWYNKIWLCLNITIWSSQICLSVTFIRFVIISKWHMIWYTTFEFRMINVCAETQCNERKRVCNHKPIYDIVYGLIYDMTNGVVYDIWYDIWYDMIYDMMWYDMMWCDMICGVMWCDMWCDVIGHRWIPPWKDQQCG